MQQQVIFKPVKRGFWLPDEIPGKVCYVEQYEDRLDGCTIMYAWEEYDWNTNIKPFLAEGGRTSAYFKVTWKSKK